MTRPPTSSTADKAFGSVPTEVGHGGPPNVVIERIGSGERDPQLVESSVPGYSSPGAGSTGQRLFGQEANNDRVA